MTYYKIDGVDASFRSLRNAKRYISMAYNQGERYGLFRDSFIRKYSEDIVLSKTPILVTNDGYSFGKTKRL